MWLHRTTFTARSTIGEWWFNGGMLCFTIEDVEREHKIPRVTAIPRGRYEIVVTQSKRFKRALPLLLDVPGFEGIRVHAGNTADDTEGCICVGLNSGQDVVIHSKPALALVQGRINAALYSDRVFLNITGKRE